MKKELIILFLLLQIIKNLNSINTDTSTSIIKELQKNLYAFNSKEYQNNKDTLNKFINSININDKKTLQNLEKIKNDLFIISVFFDNKKGVLIALNLGAEINLKPPIFWAIYTNNEKVFEFLKESGADLSCTLENRKTPMQAAIETENIKLIESLKNKKIYIDDNYKKEIKALKNKEIVRILAK
nr:ankyrin repeat domain-containing protein [Borreliella garinii]